MIAVVVVVRRDALTQDLAALCYVSNRFQISRHVSYSALFAAPSRLEHLWSLAVEEQ